MGPKVVGFRGIIWEDDPLQRVEWTSYAHPDVLLSHNTGETQEEAILIHLENDRRRLTFKIRAAAVGIPDQVPMQPVRRLSFDTPLNEILTKLSPEPILKYRCPRYDEIKKFLFGRKTRRDLALDTMNFVMPEHTLLGYIIRNGKLQPELKPDEWRNFLIITHHTKELFS
jgi:hypothetical protein